jgi:hypothetical protein
VNYLLLIYGDEKAESAATKAEQEALMSEYWAYTEALRQAGVNIAAEALHPTSSATTIRVKNDKAITTHGPFAETTEQLGGFYLISCTNLDEAIEWAAKCPGARTGSIEIRPVVDFSQVM